MMKHFAIAMRPFSAKWSRPGIYSNQNIIRNFKRCVPNLCRQYYSVPESSKEKLEQLSNQPGLKDFLIAGKNVTVKYQENETTIPYLDDVDINGNGRKVFFEVYGCQMNVNDTEVVWSILRNNGYKKADNIDQADVVLLITCAIREKAETRIWKRLHYLSNLKKRRKGEQFQVGILGCMAERLKTQLLEKERSVDVVAGPDSYKDLPRLLAITKSGNQRAVNVLLSLDETYADIMPVRLNENASTAFVSIMRGCDNMCTYCIVPFTRGRERSRPINSIEQEAKQLATQGIKEITLLGQNVNSYRDLSADPNRNSETKLASGFRTVYKDKKGGLRFAELLERVAESVPNVRIRFTSPHPKDFPDDVLTVMKRYPNICRSIHLPAQSGNSAVLERMRRGYTREAYLELVERIRNILPNVVLSSDFICGFCGETDEEFIDTVTLMEHVKYNIAYLFAYSMREKTTAHRRFTDDIPQEVKIKRLQELAKIYRSGADGLHSKLIGQHQLILVEGRSKRSELEYYGRNDSNIKVIFPVDKPIAKTFSASLIDDGIKRIIQPGDFIVAKIYDSNSQTLKGIPLYHTTITDYINEPQQINECQHQQNYV